MRTLRAIVAGSLVIVATACATGVAPEPSGTFHTASLRVQTITPAPTAVGSRTPDLQTGTVMVEMGDQWFLPEQIRVTAGTTVVWVNRGQLTHSVVGRGGAFTSGTMEFGRTFSFTFTRPGRYAYFCQQHTDMIGEVDVQ